MNKNVLKIVELIETRPYEGIPFNYYLNKIIENEMKKINLY